MNRDAQRSRQSALIEEQMLELERKRALEEDEASRRERSKIDARRNDSQAISDAKQRYLERKKQRLAATPASASAPPQLLRNPVRLKLYTLIEMLCLVIGLRASYVQVGGRGLVVVGLVEEARIGEDGAVDEATACD